MLGSHIEKVCKMRLIFSIQMLNAEMLKLLFSDALYTSSLLSKQMTLF